MTDRLAEIKSWLTNSCTLTEYGALNVQWLIAEVERLSPDAERWRVARNHWPECLMHRSPLAYLRGDEADAAVDAARKAT